MKIVQLENYVSNFDKLIDESYWSEFGDFTCYDRTPQDEVIKRAAGADVLLTNKTKLGEAEFAALPDLKYVGVLATGYNVVDCEAAKRHGVIVTNVPAYSTESVAQLTFAHILNLMRSVETHAQSDWSGMTDFSCCLTPQFEINGMTLGLIGFGAIGSAVAKIADAFGMKVLVYTRTPDKVNTFNAKAVDLKELLQKSDIVSLHCPQTPQTIKIINADTIAQMKDGAYLINTSRGGLIDEDALADALRSGKIAGAGLDVLSTEPPPADHPLLHLKNCRISPHIAWASKEARKRLFDCARQNLQAWLDGKAQNVVNL